MNNAGSKYSLQKYLYLTKVKITLGASWNVGTGKRPWSFYVDRVLLDLELEVASEAQLHSGRTEPGIHPGQVPLPFLLYLSHLHRNP